MKKLNKFFLKFGWNNRWIWYTFFHFNNNLFSSCRSLYFINWTQFHSSCNWSLRSSFKSKYIDLSPNKDWITNFRMQDNRFESFGILLVTWTGLLFWDMLFPHFNSLIMKCKDTDLWFDMQINQICEYLEFSNCLKREIWKLWLID